LNIPKTVNNMSYSGPASTGNDYVLRIAWVAHRGAGEEAGAEASRIILQLVPKEHFIVADSQPDIILFMSGGSERRAIELADPGRPLLLLSIRGNNAYAAATEVMAWMISRGRVAVLSDGIDAAGSGLIECWRKVAGACQGMQGKKAGLIGSVSEWLVASDVSPDVLKKTLGVSLEEISWNSLPDYTASEPDKSLTERFAGYDASGLKEASQVLTVLRGVIEEKELSAIAVECFSLVQQRKVTACLALAQLNTEGIVAACEGDLASMAGMLLLKALTGRVPWMANTTRITDKSLILSHCTIAFDMVSDIKLPTHYETACSLALDGSIPAGQVTLFRLSDSLEKAFIAEGEVVSRPHLEDTCRTQVKIELPEQSLDVLRNRPLGNHLLMIPGRYSELLCLAIKYEKIRLVN
jgi:L-fucose isomerase-like protein